MSKFGEDQNDYQKIEVCGVVGIEYTLWHATGKEFKEMPVG